jgi:hypothetical protein
MGPLAYRTGGTTCKAVIREPYHRERTIAWSSAVCEKSEKSVGTRIFRISITQALLFPLSAFSLDPLAA